MLSQVHSQPVAPTKILEFRSQYKSCRIRVPDLELPVAAILVDREYYSFFNTVQEPSKVLAIVAKLGNRGDGTAITKTEARLCNLGHRAGSQCCQVILTHIPHPQLSQSVFTYFYR